MPYCGKCGRWIETGETCSCDKAEGNEQTDFPITPASRDYDPNFDPYISGQAEIRKENKKGDTVLKSVIAFAVLCIMVIVASFIIIPAYYIRHMEKENKKMKHVEIAADDLRNASDAAFEALREKDVKLRGMYFICSDKNSNAAVPFDEELFYKELEKHLAVKKSKVDYFIIVRDGKTQYAATAYSWTKGVINTYPSENKAGLHFSFDGGGNGIERNENLDGVYWNAYDKVFN